MEYRGPWDDVEVPDVTLYDLLFEGIDGEVAGRVALASVEDGTSLTFGQLKQDVDALASWLSHQGIGAGDAVAVVLANRPEYATAFHGIARCGAAVTPVNPAAHPHEVARQLGLTRARLVVTDQSLLPHVEQALGELEGPAPRIVVLDGDPGHHLAWRDVLDTPVDLPESVVDPATHPVCLPMSSGTGGLPKAVVLSHRNLVANMLQFDAVIADQRRPGSMVAFLPYSHIYALTTNLNYALLRRHTQYTMGSFQARLFLETVSTRHPTILFVVPPVATFLARNKAAEAVDWSSVQLVVSGAAPLDGPVGEAMQSRLGTRVLQGYGMTELSPVSHLIPPDRPDIALDTIGPAIPNCRFRIVDPATGQDVAPAAEGAWSEPGELWVAGPNTMLGYLAAPEASDAVLDDEGWVHTGDLARVDREGVVRIVDRLKELIKRRGFQIPPAELEAHLVLHPDVADAAVLGLGATSGDQVPHALLVLREGADAGPTEVLQWLNEQVAPYKRVPAATVVDALPRSAAGKILRRQLPGLVG